MQYDIYAWILLPMLIFFARVCDVTLGTIRIIFISKGIKHLAPLIGFFEILIWLLAISQIMQNLNNPFYYIFYAGGFGCGTFVGIIIDEKLSIGSVAIRIITRKDATKLVKALNDKDFGLTLVDAESYKGKVKIIFSVIKRHQIIDVVTLLRKYNPTSFYSIEDIRFVSENSLTYNKSKFNIFHDGLLSRRKGK